MRLTLRTLLAYLDDLLEPAQAKELGAKIQESEKAAELIMKIRDVIRKRRLTAPVVNGPGCDLDANTVADYLDNTLPPDGVTELEQLCLDSDIHLAEVAACHQILTLVLGEPVDISSHSRDRMYALGQTLAPKREVGHGLTPNASASRSGSSAPVGSSVPGEASAHGGSGLASAAGLVGTSPGVTTAGRAGEASQSAATGLDSSSSGTNPGTKGPGVGHANTEAGRKTADTGLGHGVALNSGTASGGGHASHAGATNRELLEKGPSSQRGDSFIARSPIAAAQPGSAIHGKAAAGSSGPNSQTTNGPTSDDHGALRLGGNPGAHSQTSASGVGLTPKPAAVPHHGLGPAVKSIATAETSSSDALAGKTSVQKIVTAEHVDRTIPDYLKPPPLWKRALPLAILLLLAVWVGMLVKDKDLLSDLLGKKPEATNGIRVADHRAAENTVATNPANAIGLLDTGKGLREAEAEMEETGTSNTEGDATDLKSSRSRDLTVAKVEPGVEPGIDALPPADAGEEPDDKKVPLPDGSQDAEASGMEPSAGPAGKNRPQGKTSKESDSLDQEPPTKSGPQLALSDSPMNNDSDLTAKNPVKPLKPVPSAQPTTDNRSKPARYVSTDGVVLRFDDDREGWFPLPHREFVFAEDILAVPEPFEAQIQFSADKHRLTAIGPALIQVVDVMNDFPFGISIERGRFILQPAEIADGAEMQPRLKVALSVQGQTWLLELPDPTSRCGVEIIPREPRQLDEDFGSQGWSGKMYIVSGSVKVTTPEGKATIISGPDTYVLAPDPNASDASPTQASTAPAWLSERKMSSAAKLNAVQFQKTLTQDESSAHDSLLPVVIDRVPEKSRLATACLGLIGDYQMMLEVLDRNEHHESREAAIAALRSWINLHPQNREKLKAEIGTKFFKDDAPTLYRLIWGYQEQDLRGKQVSRQLVSQLEHDNLAIRELACYYIRTLTGRKLDFDARGPQTQRNAAIQQLNRILSKEETLLPSLPKGASATNRRN